MCDQQNIKIEQTESPNEHGHWATTITLQGQCVWFFGVTRETNQMTSTDRLVPIE